MTFFTDTLLSHEKLTLRKESTLRKLTDIRAKFSEEDFLKCHKNVCIFSAGSLGRLDSGKHSDLDVFVTADGDEVSKLEEIQLFSVILKINDALDYPPLSNDGQYLRTFHIAQNKPHIGSPTDDKENWFTTRMLLLLESNYLANSETYNDHIKQVLEVYFRDSVDHEPFNPLFLLNDILRFWRTLCLNYEQVRHNKEREWKKRNFNLRFSRMLTVFSTVLPLILESECSLSKFLALTTKSPLERFATGLDKLTHDATSLRDRYIDFLDCYEAFLVAKESGNFQDMEHEKINELKKQAEFFSSFIFDSLTHADVPPDYRKYLII